MIFFSIQSTSIEKCFNRLILQSLFTIQNIKLLKYQQLKTKTDYQFINTVVNISLFYSGSFFNVA